MPLIATRSNAGAFGLGWSSAGGEELGGMVLLKPTSITSVGGTATLNTDGSISFSGCYELSLNQIFSADYENYMIAFRSIASSSSPSWDFRLRSGTTNASGNDYTYQALMFNGSSASSSVTSSTSVGRVHQATTSYTSGDVAYIFGPHLAQKTVTRSASGFGFNGAAIYDYTSIHNLANSYDGISFIQTSSYTFEGIISVYGLVGT